MATTIEPGNVRPEAPSPQAGQGAQPNPNSQNGVFVNQSLLTQVFSRPGWREDDTREMPKVVLPPEEAQTS